MITDKDALNLITLFQQNGFEAYAVGGCVRDTLLCRPVSDIDIAVSCLPETTVMILENNGIRCVKTGIKHGTVTAVTSNGTYELTTFRTDGDYKDFRRPDTVNFVTDIKQDLSRRDFTINAMAFNTDTGLVDLFGGKYDLDNKIIRAVGDPDARFKEDALRILRALRFASVLGFDIEPDTAAAIHRNKELLCNIARERIASEISKFLIGSHITYVLNTFSDVLVTVLPILDNISKKHAWNDTVKSVSSSVENADIRLGLMLYFAADLQDSKKSEINACDFAINSLKLKNLSSRLIRFLIKNADVEMIPDKYTLKKLMFNFGVENLRALVEFKKALGEDLNETETIIEDIISSGETTSLSGLRVTGKDMLALGYKGSAIADALTNILHYVMRGELSNNREEILNFMKVKIRKSTMRDFERICEIYSDARKFMKNNGNPSQWSDKYPPLTTIKQDIADGVSYVCELAGEVSAVFMLSDSDASYLRIDDGKWLDNGDYGVIHRVASNGTIKGVTSYIMDFCKSKYKNLRGDTHKDNLPMQHVFEKNGFVKCGTVYAEDDTARIAYQYIGDK